MGFTRRGFVAFALVLVATFITVLEAQAQHADEVFGKNRIQFRQFEWQYLSGENFDVYYYDARKGIAQEALEFLESEFDRITDQIDYPPYFKTKIFLYNSLADLRQSNMGLNRSLYKTGGETNFIKPYIEVAHLGTAQEFKDELLFKMSDLMINEMMYGGNLKDIFQSSILQNLPDWFAHGASLYVARGWSIEMDDYIRELIQTRKANHATRLTGKQAALVGQSIWNFITEKYGKSSMANILNYTRVTRNEERSITITLGISFKQLLVEWRKFYTEMESTVSKSYLTPDDSLHFTRQDNRTTEFTTIKISPDGRNIAYAENDRGRYVVTVRSLETGREKKIISGGSKVIGQRVDYRQPIIAWSDANTLGVIAVKYGQYVFWLYDLSTRTKVPRELEKFSNIRSFDFSGNGRLIIMSADFDGKSDLFLLSTRRDRVKRLTNDLFDDLDPTFIPNTNRVVFSSNRSNDTLRSVAKPQFQQLSDVYNLFIYDLDSTNLKLTRVTNTVSKDVMPIAIDDNNFLYLTDQRGIINLFKFNRLTGIYSQITNFSSSIQSYDLNYANNMMAWVTSRNLRENIFVSRDFTTQKQVFTPATMRKQMQQARVIRDKRKKDEPKNMSVKELLNSRLNEAKEEQAAEKNPDSVSFKSRANINSDTVIVQTPAKKEQSVNTDNYVFEDEVDKPAKPTESFLSRYKKANDKGSLKGPFPYEPKFSADNLVTSFTVDNMRGFGIQLETQMNDMLENYRINGGLYTPLNLRGGDVFLEFQYLPSLIDFSLRYDRKAIRWETLPQTEPSNSFKYTLNRIELNASLPITDRLRFTLKPFAEAARSIDLGETDYPTTPVTQTPNVNYYAGIQSELVYDNSISTGLNLIEGTRGKIFFQHHQGLGNADMSFSQASIDLRHYQKIYKEIVIAFRGYAGTFFGNAPKKYLLGGMDSWFYNTTQVGGRTSEGQPNPLGSEGENQDILFVEFATNLRGFDLSTLFGNSVMMGSAELRIPVVKALSSGPITSNFLKNLMFVGFYDVGTSWSGKPPFGSGNNNSVSVSQIVDGPFEIDIKNYLNPWLYSYGFGVRTVVFGYYVKGDLAWPVENYQVQKPRFHFTLGFDF
ncbi:MAG TPA: translocation protein TolB [Chryseolinea sp.]|nr:translocation protein TolB [Chryseolinea sp.]HPH46174.1 translocation protein TolB [Chryseolinea sp.]HPM30336.1 translocation protein TolB [Chryseolinea sp.]